jgi:hypothetical protein
MHNRGLIYFIISVTCFFIATSCNTEKRLQKAEVLLSSKGRLAKICADRFPPRDSVVYRDSVSFDTLYEGIYSIDTIYDKDTVKVYLTLPAKIVTKEVIKYRDIYRENTAKVKELEGKLSVCSLQSANYSIELVKLRAESSKWERLAKQRWWFFWILLVVAGLIAFRKSIMKLISRFILPWT